MTVPLMPFIFMFQLTGYGR